MAAFFTQLVSYLGAAIFFVFISLCLAAGLYSLAEYVEEHSGRSKVVLKVIIKVCLGLHALLLFDGLPILCLATGVFAHLSYYLLAHHYPFIHYKSWSFAGSAVMMIASQALWMQYFNHTAHTLNGVLCFFGVMVWFVPFTIFVSMIGMDNAPPGCSSDRGVTDLPMIGVKDRPGVDITAIQAAASGLGQRAHVRRGNSVDYVD